MHVPPERGVHGVEETARGVRPTRGAGGADRVGRGAVELDGLGVVVGIAGHYLALAVDEELVSGGARGHAGLHDALFVRPPRELQFDTAAEDGVWPRTAA